MKDLRIIFFGTPEFAVASLDALLNAGFNVVAAVTSPDKPAGRGMQFNKSEVKKYAALKNITVLQPQKLKDPAFLKELKFFSADLQVIVAFRMLPEEVWNMPPMGTINVHASLLPDYRGAAPINWAIINGERETGVTTFKLKHEIDTGNILLQEKIMIGEEETAGELHDRMKLAGANLLVKTINGLSEGTLEETPQNNPADISHAKHAPKIFTETCRIHWNRNVTGIFNLVRGLSPYPGAFTTLNDKLLKIYRGKKEFTLPVSKPGEFETDHRSYLKFACIDGYFHCTEVQIEGKKKMMIEEFLKGFRS